MTGPPPPPPPTLRLDNVRANPWLALSIIEGEHDTHAAMLTEGPAEVLPAIPQDVRHTTELRNAGAAWTGQRPGCGSPHGGCSASPSTPGRTRPVAHQRIDGRRGTRAWEWSEMMTSVTQKTATATIRFTATLDSIDESTVMRLPEEASRLLPSRGQVAVRGSMNGHEFRTVLEPDGVKGHWIKIDPALRQVAHIGAGGTVNVTVQATRDWPEPDMPQDLAAALAGAPQEIRDIWNDITPMARWEWVRWVNATASPATRQRRVEVTLSKINNGKRRPCCFDLAACTDPAVAKNGKLRSTT